MRIIVKKRTIILMVLCVILGFAIAYKIYVKPKADSKPWTITKTIDNSKQFISKETLITEIKQKQKLITTEVNINEKMTIDNSWGNLPIFKKIQNIDFIGTGVYVLDLSDINPNNVNINKNEIAITLQKPTVEMITLNEEKTIYENTENGIFRFGDIKLSTEEHQQLISTVKSKMKSKMLQDQYYNIALQNSEKSMKNLINSISDNNYIVNIKF